MPKNNRARSQFILNLSQDLLGLTDAFDMVRAFAKHALKARAVTFASLTWPSPFEDLPKPLRVENIGKLSKAASSKPLKIQFFDGELAFIQIALHFGPKRSPSTAFRGELKQGAELVRIAIQALQQTRQSEDLRRFEAIRTLSAGIGHELNTPLNSLLYFLKALEKQGGSTEPLQKVRTSALRLNEVIERFRLFSGDGVLDEARPTSLASIFGRVTQRLSRNNPGPLASQIVFPALGADLEVPARAQQLETLLECLLQNALESLERSTVERPWIRVTLETSDDRVLIRITDNGPGVAKDLRTAIFDPFFSTKEVDQGQGLGLGLSIARAIAFAHQGSLKLNPLSRHTQFVLELPLWGHGQSVKRSA